MASCTEVEAALPALALGSLDDDERADILAHIETCPHCAALLHEYTWVSQGLLMAVPQRMPPAALKANLMQRVQAPQRSWIQRLGNFLNSGQMLPRWSVGLGAAFGILMITVLAARMVNLNSEHAQVEQQLHQQQAALAMLSSAQIDSMQMTATHEGSTVSAVLRYDSNQTLAVFHAQDLPALSPDQSFQLWLIDADGKRDSGAVFSVPTGSDGKVTLLVVSPRNLGTYVRCGVTVEPRGGSPGPTSPAILTGKYSS